MKVPDADDHVEFMLYRDPRTPEQRGVKNHISLEVPDAQKALADLDTPAPKAYSRDAKVQIGKNANSR
jgi:hypothetical protein